MNNLIEIRPPSDVFGTGILYRVTVDTGGYFRVYEHPDHNPDGDDPVGCGYSLPDVLEKLKPKAKRQAIKIAISVSQWVKGTANKPGHVEHGMITGRHAGNGSYLIKWERDGKQVSESVKDYQLRWLFSRLSESEVAMLTAAKQREAEASQAVAELEVTFRPKTALDVLVKQALTAVAPDVVAAIGPRE